MDYWTVVTNVVNPTAFSLKIKVFGRRLTTFVTRLPTAHSVRQACLLHIHESPCYGEAYTRSGGFNPF